MNTISVAQAECGNLASDPCSVGIPLTDEEIRIVFGGALPLLAIAFVGALSPA